MLYFEKSYDSRFASKGPTLFLRYRIDGPISVAKSVDSWCKTLRASLVEVTFSLAVFVEAWMINMIICEEEDFVFAFLKPGSSFGSVLSSGFMHGRFELGECFPSCIH